MKNIFTFSFIILFVFSSSLLEARNFRPGQIPNGAKNSCSNCHVNSGGGGTRTPFGETVRTSFLTSPTGNVKWGPDLAAIDSDGDGFTNGEELQDPNGVWTIGTLIGDRNLVTNPGDANDFPATTDVDFDGINGIVNTYALNQNYPNPFNPSTTISFSVKNSEQVTLRVYNNVGQLVEELVNENLAPGNYSANWNAKNLASGIYYYSINTASFTQTKK